jgi:hypothetical protein
MRPTTVLSACALLGLTACQGAINRFTVNSTAPVLKLGSAAIDSEGDVVLAREAAPASLKTVESFSIVSPNNPFLLEVLANGFAQYTFGFLEDDLEVMGQDESEPRQKLVDRCTYLYDRSYAFAVRLASLTDKKFEEALKGDTRTLEDELNRRFGDEDDAPGLYWAGLALGSAINLHRDDMNRVADLPKAIALLERAHFLDPKYFHHGAALTLGVIFSSQGKAMGGDPDKAKKLFDEAINGTDGKFLMARVLYARFYATVTQDRALFEKTLREVLATPVDIWPEQRLANTLAKRRAARYLAQVEDLF